MNNINSHKTRPLKTLGKTNSFPRMEMSSFTTGLSHEQYFYVKNKVNTGYSLNKSQ